MKHLHDIINTILAVIFLLGWLAGFVIAVGFWSTLLAIIPFYAWYLVIERVMLKIGWL